MSGLEGEIKVRLGEEGTRWRLTHTEERRCRSTYSAASLSPHKT